METAALLEYVKNSEFSLFLGAGASVPGGGPTSPQLLSEIRKKYPQVGEESDFFRVFDLILAQGDSEMAKVEEFLKSILVSITPKKDHKYVFSLPWRAVLTTNYDRIPDLVDTTLDGNRVILSLIGPGAEIDIRKQDRLYCLKLLGDISFSYPQEGHMVLTNTDRRRAYSRQSVFFNLFRDLAKSGVVIYLGYSFEDELVFDILNDLLFEVKNFPHKGFAVIPSKPSEAILQKMKQYNIEWVQGTLEDFVVESKKVFGETPKSCSISINPIKVHGKIIELDRATFPNIRGKVKLAHQGLFASDYGDPRSFLEGKEKSFVPFQEGWDFPGKWNLVHNSRKAEPERFTNVETLVTSRAETGNPADNLMYALIGAAGSGKSTVANRIAFEWYTNGNPVLFLEPTNVFVDTTAVESLLDEIWNKFRKQRQPDENLKEKIMTNYMTFLCCFRGKANGFLICS